MCNTPFLRAFKFVGTFVIMIYRMLAKDLLRFVIVYAIITIGFSQCKDNFLNILWPFKY